SIRVATSMRSGTIHRLHISEFGKICAKYPDKAKEVMTGSIPAVPKTGILVIESTAEGQQGEFFELCQDARHKREAGKILTQRDYRFHFYPWWDEPNYRLDVA
ncbi:terminase, partial [Escherichia coli]